VTNPVNYTFEQLVYGVGVTVLIFMVLCVPLFYLAGHWLEEHRVFIGKVYTLYKIVGIIIAIGLFLWMINQ
jgi:hypothetical protein